MYSLAVAAATAAAIGTTTTAIAITAITMTMAAGWRRLWTLDRRRHNRNVARLIVEHGATTRG